MNKKKPKKTRTSQLKIIRENKKKVECYYNFQANVDFMNV